MISSSSCHLRFLVADGFAVLPFPSSYEENTDGPGALDGQVISM